MNKALYVGLDVHKDTIAVAVAEDGCGSEIRFHGTIVNSANAVLRLTKTLTKNGFLCLATIMERATRKVLSWRLSNTMHADFCVDALTEDIVNYGPPEIMNTVQGSQFTGSAWIIMLIEADVRISMDGRGRYLDNIFTERLWRSQKQEAIRLERSATAARLARLSKAGWHSKTLSAPIPRLISTRLITQIGRAWKNRKRHET